MEKNNHCLYRHLKPCGEVFYIGIGKDLKRPYNKISRSKYWKNKVKRYPDYEVQILKYNLTKAEACELEMLLISWYGRADLGEGNLVNLTNGGESTYGRVMEQWQKDKMSENQKGTKLGEDNPNYGNKWTDEQKKYMSELKKEGYKSGELFINREGDYKGIVERNRRWEENPQLKADMQKKVSENHNLYEYLKLSMDGVILEVYQNRLEVREAYPDAGKTVILSVCNGYKRSYKGFLWRYRDRESNGIIEPTPKWNKGLRDKLKNLT